MERCRAGGRNRPGKTGMRSLVLAALWAMAAGAAIAAAPPRLAIVSGGNAGDLSALLVAELGKNEGVALVERDDLAKMGDEAQLRQMAGAKPADLGRLLGADGLLFLNAAPDGIEIRFTAVRLGFALFDDRFAPGADLPHLAALITGRVADYAPKLGLRPGEAIPVSVLNLRASVADPQASGMERKLTLLLEGELASLPDCVVLERRHASALKFENLLSGEDLALLRGVSVVDGELVPPSEGKEALAANLRVRGPGREPVAVRVDGSVKDLPALAAAMAAAIEKKIGAAAPPGPWQARAEAREYLLEGIWGYQHDAIPAALEALDSAELLGESAPDLTVARIPVLCAVAVGSPNVIRGDADTPDDPHPEARVEAISRAIDEAARYEKGGPGGDLQVLDRADLSLWNAGFLHGTVCRAASSLLGMLDRTHSPQADGVRSALREFAGFDPLHGKVPRPLSMVLGQADAWSVSMDEETGFYRGLCAVKPEGGDWMAAANSFVPTEFCARFIPDPEQRRAALLEFARSLLADPSTRPVGLLILARPSGSGGAEGPSQVFFDELWARRDELAAMHQFNRFLIVSFDLERNILVPEADPQLVALLRFGLQHADSVDGFIDQAWSPELFPAKDAPALWGDLQALAQKAPANPASLPERDRHFSNMRRRYIARFGNPAGAGENALAVDRFWQPNDLAASPRFAAFPLAVGPDGVWLATLHGNDKAEVDGAVLYHVALDASRSHPFATDVVPCPGLYPQEAVVTGKAVYLIGEPPGQFAQSVLARFDLASRRWEKHAIPASRRVFEAGDRNLPLLERPRGHGKRHRPLRRGVGGGGDPGQQPPPPGAEPVRRPGDLQRPGRLRRSRGQAVRGDRLRGDLLHGREAGAVAAPDSLRPARFFRENRLAHAPLREEAPARRPGRNGLPGRSGQAESGAMARFAQHLPGNQDGRLPVAASAAAPLVPGPDLALAGGRREYARIRGSWRRSLRLRAAKGNGPIPASLVSAGRAGPPADPLAVQDGRRGRACLEEKGRGRRRPHTAVPGAAKHEPADVRDRLRPLLLCTLQGVLVSALRGPRPVSRRAGRGGRPPVASPDAGRPGQPGPNGARCSTRPGATPAARRERRAAC